jgi:hypothetical protein
VAGEQAVHHNERLREPRLVEAEIVVRGQVEQLIFCILAVGQDGI